MGLRVIIDIDKLPKAELFDCREEVEEMMKNFTKEHPNIHIPSNAIKLEGDIFGIKITKSLT